MKKYIAAAIILVFVLGGLTSVFFSGSPIRQEPQTQQEPQNQTPVEKLVVEDIKTGAGAEAKTGNTVSVHYAGTLLDGTKFDSSFDRGQPFSFTLGKGQVIPGWEQGVLGMKAGGKRKLTIPPSLAYGEQAVGPIPANSILAFEIELLEVK